MFFKKCLLKILFLASFISSISEYGSNKAFEELIAAYDKYDVIYLGCYCTPEQSCHGDVIIKKINQFVVKRHIDKIIGHDKCFKEAQGF